MLKRSFAVFAFFLVGSIAQADQVTVTNSTPNTIYALYSWPYDLAVRTLNILGRPVAPGDSAVVDIDNAYGDCDFMLQTDPNNPTDLKRRNYRRKDIEMRAFNLCQSNGKVELKPADAE